MKAAWQILNAVLIKQFYIHHAGLFLFAFLFLFGIVDAGHIVSYHRSLMLSIISLPLFLWIVLGTWLLYIIQCAGFCVNTILAPEGSFIFQLRAVAASSQIFLYAITSVLLYLPVLSYSLVLAAFSHHLNPAVTWQVLIWQVLMITLSTAAIFFAVNNTSESPLTRFIANARKRLSVQKNYMAFLATYILYEKKASFALVKIFSLLLLGMLLVRNADRFDADLFSIFYPLTIVAHAMLVFHCVYFNERYLQVARNLPLSWLKVAVMYTGTWILILLPETFFMILNSNNNLTMLQITMQVLMAVTVLFLFTAMALGCGLNQERYLLFAFIVYIIILILQKSVGNIAAVGCTAILSLMVFKAHYYSFEEEPAP